MNSSEALKHRLITLTTDFGYKDPFVGEMKGVILSINPSAVIVDLTHGIGAQNIEEGAFVIGSSYRYFPSESIHVSVVDPGVGSDRRPVIVEADGHYFVGPDNGIFSYLMACSLDFKVVHITEDKFFLSKESTTFQGRDLFAPVAAWLSKGKKIEEFGPVICDYVRFDIPQPIIENSKITGEVIYIDGFGNAIANIKKDSLATFQTDFKVKTSGMEFRPVNCYSEARDASLNCLVNSSGHLELFVNRGSASRLFGIDKGEKVVISKG